ncbi:hypothetical protein, partial [Escherichia coli]|uniref:hypothetical protein n=1 Tax=Escherichia coli TaxID=562 RepID=UPI00385574B9
PLAIKYTIIMPSATTTREDPLMYIRSWSVWLDLKIIFLTVFKGFINKSAY